MNYQGIPGRPSLFSESPPSIFSETVDSIFKSILMLIFPFFISLSVSMGYCEQKDILFFKIEQIITT